MLPKIPYVPRRKSRKDGSRSPVAQLGSHGLQLARPYRLGQAQSSSQLANSTTALSLHAEAYSGTVLVPNSDDRSPSQAFRDNQYTQFRSLILGLETAFGNIGWTHDCETQAHQFGRRIWQHLSEWSKQEPTRLNEIISYEDRWGFATIRDKIGMHYPLLSRDLERAASILIDGDHSSDNVVPIYVRYCVSPSPHKSVTPDIRLML